MSADLIIRYKHDMTDAKEHVCTGEMFYRPSDGALPPHDVWEFEKTPFNKLLAEASNRMNKDTVEVERILIERTDRQGLQPIVLDNPTKEILKADPALAIKLLTYDNRGTASGRTVTSRQEAPPPMRSGYDSLAQAIGDEVYCRVHKAMVECPGCGMWSSAVHPGLFTCKKKCLIANVPVIYTEQWARFKVTDLLMTMLPKYFVPREWNPTKPWISRETLEEMYNTWKQTEKRMESAS